MYDIMKYIDNDRIVHQDPYGKMLDLDKWSPQKASGIAASEGVFLHEPHWDVLFFLRETYRLDSCPWKATDLTRLLHEKFSEQGGKRFLYSIFPYGPIKQACKIAGLPSPTGVTDNAFGNVH